MLKGGVLIASALFIFACSHLSTKDTTLEPGAEFYSYASLPLVPEFEGDLFLIFAHADDELMTLSYVAQIHKKYPFKAIHWILVSDSGKGWILTATCGIEGVKNPIHCRSEEAKKAAACVGLNPPYEMKLPDGGLKNVKDLDKKIFAVMEKLAVEKVGVVLTSDNTGVYGHPDHLAVHDSVKRLATLHHWPMLVGAIPKEFREKIKMRPSGKGRVDDPVNHVVKLDDSLKKQVACAIDSHKSQQFMLMAMRQFLTPAGFLDKIPIQFFNLTEH